jgi:hypothetical protein
MLTSKWLEAKNTVEGLGREIEDTLGSGFDKRKSVLLVVNTASMFLYFNFLE